MKAMWAIILLAVSFAPFGAGAAGASISMGYFELPPHCYAERTNRFAGKPKGALIEYFEAVASEMGYETEWVGPLPLPRLSKYLQEGTIDGTVGFPKYPKFEEFLDYPESHVFVGQPTLVVRKESPLEEIRSVDDIKGYRIGLVKSISGKYTPLLDDNRAELTVEELGGDGWVEQNIRKLLAGRLDALFDRQDRTIPFVAKRLGLDSQIKVLAIPDAPTPFYMVFSKRSPVGKAFVERCEPVIRRLNLDYGDLLRQ